MDIIEQLRKGAIYDCNSCSCNDENCEGDECEHIVAEKIVEILDKQSEIIEELTNLLRNAKTEAYREYAERAKAEYGGSWLKVPRNDIINRMTSELVAFSEMSSEQKNNTVYNIKSEAYKEFEASLKKATKKEILLGQLVESVCDSLIDKRVTDINDIYSNIKIEAYIAYSERLNAQSDWGAESFEKLGNITNELINKTME